MYIQTTLGQLNFFKWAIENEVIRYIQENYTAIETDMNIRNNTTRKLAKSHQTSSATVDGCVLASGSDAISSVTADHSVIVLASGSDAISSVTADHSVASGSSVVSGSVVASKANVVPSQGGGTPKQRKKREELSSSATKSIKKEFVDIVITFD
jgi:NDP-sugar pyrophosphorylase family protein